ncbi:MAG: thermonuclease family protein [Candidatus Dadabacteria bacterium]
MTRDAGGEDITIRLIGIDTPELPMPEGEAAKRHVERILQAGKVVELDVQVLDIYYRTLACVWLPYGKMPNEELILKGVAVPMTVPPNVKYIERFIK